MSYEQLLIDQANRERFRNAERYWLDMRFDDTQTYPLGKDPAGKLPQTMILYFIFVHGAGTEMDNRLSGCREWFVSTYLKSLSLETLQQCMDVVPIEEILNEMESR